METKTITLHKHQDEAIYSPARFIAIISGLQGGKTTAGAIWSRIQFDQNKEDDGLICAPTYKILMQSTLPKFFQINKDMEKYYKKGDSVIEVPSRGKIYIRSTENPNVLEGMTLRWAWLDEAGQMKREAWVNIQGRLSILQGKCFITTTPYSINWLYTEFFEEWKKRNNDYHVVQFKSIDSPYFPQEEFDRVQKTMDRRTFERRYCGEFTKMEGLVYDEFYYSTHVVDVLPRKFDYVIAGVDWGFRAPTALVVVGIYDEVFYIMDEYYREGKTIPEIVEYAKNLRQTHSISRFYADSENPEAIHTFKQAGLPTFEAYKDIEFGVAKVKAFIAEDKLRIHVRCKNLLEEIETYHYPEEQEGKEMKEKPVKVDDHAMDALRYALATFQHIKPSKKNATKVQIKRFSHIGI